MPRFDLFLVVAGYTPEDEIESNEYEIMCYVKDENDFAEIQKVANEVIQEEIENSDNLILFGTAAAFVRGQEVLNIALRNKDIDPEEVNQVAELFGSTGEETIH